MLVTSGRGVADGRAVAAPVGVPLGRALGSALELGTAEGALETAADGVADGFADALASGEADGDGAAGGDSEGDGSGEGVGANVGSGFCGAACGTGVTIGADVAPNCGSVPRFWKAETSAPIPSPATITPIANATVGSGPLPVPPPLAFRDGGGADGRRRGGRGSDIATRFPRIRQEALPPRANALPMIRVRVPIDVNAVLCADSTAFALATPLRVGELLSHAILDALGPRAPQDKRERTIARTHAGLNDGAFIVEIDGRIYEHCDDVAVVAGIANVRFYRRERRDTAA